MFSLLLLVGLIPLFILLEVLLILLEYPYLVLSDQSFQFLALLHGELFFLPLSVILICAEGSSPFFDNLKSVIWHWTASQFLYFGMLVFLWVPWLWLTRLIVPWLVQNVNFLPKILKSVCFRRDWPCFSASWQQILHF